MSSTQAKPVADSAASKPFSYAQAARAASNASSMQSSKPASGSITPAKDQSALQSLKSDLTGAKWADAMEDEIKDHSSASTAVDTQSTSSMKSPTSHPVVNGTSSPASLDFAGSTSTLARDETASPMADVPEATWESKSQAPAGIRPQKFPADRASSKSKKRNGRKQDRKDKADGESAAEKDTWIQPPPAPLTEAPVPQVNIWQVRLQQKTSPAAKSVPSSKPVESTDSTPSREEPPKPVASRVPEAKIKTDQSVPADKEKNESEVKKLEDKPPARKELQSKMSSPMVDQKSWPTPEIAQEEDHKKKPQEAAEVVSAHAPPKGKSAWEKIDFTPSVVFNTPLPNTGARRGGRGGGRGGREGQGRASINGEKHSDPAVTGHSTDTFRRAARSGSRDRSKREEAPRRQSRQGNSVQDFPTRAANVEEDKTRSTEVADHNGSSTGRPVTTMRKGPRRPDVLSLNGEKRRDDSSSAENGLSNAARGAGAVADLDASVNAPREEGPQPDESLDGAEKRSSTNFEPGAKGQDRKGHGSYPPFSSRERAEHRGRGGHRGGRIGAHAYHTGNHALGNGQLSNPYSAASYNGSNPRSPTGFDQDPYFGHPQSHRYGGRGYGSRGSAMATDNGYARMSNYPGNGLQINTGVQGNAMYPGDYYMPATAIPYAQEPSSNLVQAVAVQVEYYFSVDNLIKDMYFRKHMDSQGFVFLSFVAAFKRLKSMTLDLELIKFVCQQSHDVEHCIGSDGVDRLRAARGWDKWVLPKADRDATAQNDGPESTSAPPRPHPQIFEMNNALRHTSLPAPNSAGPVLGGSQGYQSLNGFAASYPYGANGTTDKLNGAHAPTSSVHDQGAVAALSYVPFGYTGNGVADEDPDTFTDAEVENLRIVYRNPTAGENNGKSHPMPTRSFSNGSLDGSSLADGIGGLRIATDPAITSSDPVPNDLDSRASPVHLERVGEFLNGSQRPLESRSTSNNGRGQDRSSNINGVFWTKDKDSPQTHEPPPETTTDLYYSMRERALQQRNYQQCPHDMTVIYNFWSHFLVRNFNSRMYAEFRMLAMDDLTSRSSFIGLNSLLKYYGGALANEAAIRRSVASDYVSLVKSEPQHSDRPAFKQLRNAWRDGALNMKNRKRIKDFIDRDLETELDA